MAAPYSKSSGPSARSKGRPRRAALTCSSVTYVAINAHASSAMAVDAPAHRLIHNATDSMHLADLAMTSLAFETRSNVRLVRVIRISPRLQPIYSTPGRLLLLLSECRQLLNFRTVSLLRLVTTHAGINIRNSRVRGLVDILVTKRAFELRAVLFSYVLPVIEFDWLLRRLRLA